MNKKYNWDYNNIFSEFPIEMDELYDNSEVRIYLEEIKKYQLLAKEELDKLLLKIKTDNDEKAFLKIFHANLQIAARIALRYANLSNSIMPMDLIQEGNLALIDAIKSYDNKRGIDFYNYTNLLIKKRLFETMKKDGKMINFTPGEFTMITKLGELEEECVQEFGRELIPFELGEEYVWKNNPDYPTYFARLDVISLEDIDEEDIGSYNIDEIIDIFGDKLKLFEIFKLADLTDLEKTIIYYSYIDRRQIGIAEIGNLLDLPYNTVKYSKEKALKKLKNYSKLLQKNDKLMIKK